jgi:hypothetical protein
MKNSLEHIIHKLGKAINGRIKTPILVGGWAINMLGMSRTTLDFDFMIFEMEFDELAVCIKKMGYRQVVKTDLFARFQSERNNQLPYIDCLFADEGTYQKIASSGKKVDVFGAEFILPSAMHIIAMKLHAVKHGETHRLSKDFNDILALIEIHNIDVSTESEFAKLCARYANANIYRRIRNATNK